MYDEELQCISSCMYYANLSCTHVQPAFEVHTNRTWLVQEGMRVHTPALQKESKEKKE